MHTPPRATGRWTTGRKTCEELSRLSTGTASEMMTTLLLLLLHLLARASMLFLDNHFAFLFVYYSDRDG